MTQTLMIKVSPALKNAVAEAAQAADVNVSEFVREVVAERIGYNLAGDEALDSRGRPRAYASEEQRKQARKEAERKRQRTRNAVVNEIMRRERIESIEALEGWLRARGVSLSEDQT